ncbi:hypothetical protein MKEN_00621500 [Mycena kentingensis (nom. inval.)]|nr:hypothetical protein MKEN_00621500 [Mycena kentingensis (nom. inval.)]
MNDRDLRLRELQLQHPSHKDILEEIFQSGMLAARSRNDPLPNLPSDILKEIFSYLVPPTARLDAFFWLLPLTTVSHDWRNAVLETPLLWSYICIEAVTQDKAPNRDRAHRHVPPALGVTDEMLSEWAQSRAANRGWLGHEHKVRYHLRVASSVPLSVHFVMDHESARGAAVFDLLLAELPRWSAGFLGFSDGASPLWDVFQARAVQAPLPGLQSLALINPPRNISPAFWESLPALKSLTLGNLLELPAGALKIAHQLERATLYMPHVEFIRPLLPLLDALTSAIELTIVQQNSSESLFAEPSFFAIPKSVTLGSLSELRLGNCLWYPTSLIFGHYLAPHFKRLSMTFGYDLHRWDDAIARLHTFLMRSGCALEYLYLELDKDDVSIHSHIASITVLLQSPEAARLSELHIRIAGASNISKFLTPLTAEAEAAPRLRILALRGFDFIRGPRIDELAAARPGLTELWLDRAIRMWGEPSQTRLKVVLKKSWEHFDPMVPSKMLEPGRERSRW